MLKNLRFIKSSNYVTSREAHRISITFSILTRDTHTFKVPAFKYVITFHINTVFYSHYSVVYLPRIRHSDNIKMG